MTPVSVRRWIALLSGGMVLSVAFVAGFNVAVDPYDVFHTGLLRPAAPFNDRFNKVEHLVGQSCWLCNGSTVTEAALHRYDSYIVGSSVMGAFDPADAQRALPGTRFYNASFLGGTPADAHRVLKLVKSRGGRVRDVLMGLEVFPFLQTDDSRSPSKQHHFAVTGDNATAFYWRYLFASSLWHGFTKIQFHFKPAFIAHDIATTGRYRLVQYEREIEQDPAAFVERNFPKKRPTTEVSANTKAAWVEPRFSELQALVDWARHEGIRLHLFIHPFHHMTRDGMSPAVMEDFRARIREIAGDIPDFSQRPDMTETDTLYYDRVHYRPIVAQRVMQEVLFSTAPRTASLMD